MSKDSVAIARGIIARAIDEARNEGYCRAVVEVEAAIYSGDLYVWLQKSIAAIDQAGDQ